MQLQELGLRVHRGTVDLSIADTACGHKWVEPVSLSATDVFCSLAHCVLLAIASPLTSLALAFVQIKRGQLH